MGTTPGADDVYGFKEVDFNEKDKAAQTDFSRLAVDTLSKMVTMVTLQPFTVHAVKINCIAITIQTSYSYTSFLFLSTVILFGQSAAFLDINRILGSYISQRIVCYFVPKIKLKIG